MCEVCGVCYGELPYKERVIKNLAAYKCLRRTEYVERLYYIITTKVFFCIYYVSTIKGSKGISASLLQEYQFQ